MRLDNDEIIQKNHPHPLGSFGAYFTGIIFSAFGVIFFKFWFLILIGVFIIIFAEIVRTSETFYVLDGGVAREYRFLSTFRKYAEYEKIQNLEVRQSLLENILGIGSIKFDTAGLDKVEVDFNFVKNPYKIEKIVREKMKKF